MSSPALLIRNEFELQDVIDRLGRDPALVERDFALVTLAARLVDEFGDRLCFKGGFVLRHVHGHERFSKDIDATRQNPPRHKLDSAEVASVIRSAGMRNFMTLDPGQPTTDSGTSLDFAAVAYQGPLGDGSISVEVSYREAVIDGPEWATIGEPYYEPFQIPVMVPNEIVAEKLRALLQRVRPTDLSDIAQILAGLPVDPGRVKALAGEKFKLVKQGDHRGRIESNIAEMASQYDGSVSAVAPDAPTYSEAMRLVTSRLRDLLP